VRREEESNPMPEGTLSLAKKHQPSQHFSPFL